MKRCRLIRGSSRKQDEQIGTCKNTIRFCQATTDCRLAGLCFKVGAETVLLFFFLLLLLLLLLLLRVQQPEKRIFFHCQLSHCVATRSEIDPSFEHGLVAANSVTCCSLLFSLHSWFAIAQIERFLLIHRLHPSSRACVLSFRPLI